MSRFHRLGARIACAFILATTAPTVPHASSSIPLGWHDAPDVLSLAEHLNQWLDRNTDLPRRDTAPRIRLIGADRIATLRSATRASNSAQTRGLYDPATETIFLVRPWNPRSPHDVSVLLHELVHHRQAEAGHWYCDGAQELPAYRLQEAWLAELSLHAEVNWIAVVLDSGCTPRDIHPD